MSFFLKDLLNFGWRVLDRNLKIRKIEIHWATSAGSQECAYVPCTGVRTEMISKDLENQQRDPWDRDGEWDPELLVLETSSEWGICPESCGSRPVSDPCGACPLQECPTRGKMNEEMRRFEEMGHVSVSLTPPQMVLASFAVFLFPLLCAAGACAYCESHGSGIFSGEIGTVCAASAGFFGGMALAQVSLKLVRFWNGR